MTNRKREGWRLVRFGDVVREINQWDKEQAFTSFTRCVRGEDIDTDEVRIRRWGNVPEDMAPTFGKIFRAGQVLYHTRSPNLRKYSQVSFDGYCGEKVVVLETKDESVLMQDLIPYILQTEDHFQYALRTASGSTNKFTSWKKIADYEFLLPPPQQQRELVELMQGFEAAVEAGEEAVEAYAQVDEQLLLELLRKGQGWPTEQLSSFAEVRLGRQRSPDKVRGERPVKYLRAANVKEGFIDYDDVMEMDFSESEQATYELKQGDLLLVEGGEARDVGMCAKFKVADEPHCIQNTVIRVRISDKDKASPDFLFYTFKAFKRSGVFAQMASGTKLKHLGSSKMAALQVPLPNATHQAEIVRKLKVSGKGRGKALEHVAALRALRSSILNTALTPSTTAEEPALAEVLA